MNSYEEIDPADYNKHCAKFPGIEPPPIERLTISVILENKEQKLVAIPNGYWAKEASVVAGNLQSGDSLELLVGRNRFVLKEGDNKKRFYMNNEEGTVPIALFGNTGPDSSAVTSPDFVLTVEIYCECSSSLKAQWQEKIFNTIKEK